MSTTTYRDDEGWLLLLNQISSDYYTVLSKNTELVNETVPGGSVDAEYLLRNAKEIKYTDMDGITILDAYIDGNAYWEAL